jgi:hypothetical protein
MFEKQSQFAAAALASGNLPASEIVGRNIIDSDDRNAVALNLLGIIAARVGAIDHATACFKAALRASPKEDEIRGELTADKHIHRGAPSPVCKARAGRIGSYDRHLSRP